MVHTLVLLLYVMLWTPCYSADLDEITTGACSCSNSTQEEVLEACHCSGATLSLIPPDINDGVVHVLSISQANIEEIKDDTFLPYNLTLRDITITYVKNLRTVQKNVFRKLPEIQSITISQAPNLTRFPDHLFSAANTLKVLRISHTGLQNMPAFSQLGANRIMHLVDFESNQLKELTTNSVRLRTEQLLLDYNDIRFIEASAFDGCQIGKLSLRGNKMLTTLSPDTFKGIQTLRDLDLSQTSITHLPTIGLEELEVLRLVDTYTLKIIPSIYDLKSLQLARLTYSFHCCAFKYPALHDPARHAKHQAFLTQAHELCDEKNLNTKSKRQTMGNFEFGAIVGSSNENVVSSSEKQHFAFPNYLLTSDKIQFRDGDSMIKWSGDVQPPSPTDSEQEDEEVFHQGPAMMPQAKLQALCGNLSVEREPINCEPVPDALNPCEDIMGYEWLRISVWLVISTALIGNTAVLVVLLSTRSETSVPRFLMCHLAFADLCMAIYLLLLAVTDLRSTGYYFNYAFDWQRGLGCQVAGFMTVFASQLSIFTLSLLTVERWFAIRHALYTNKMNLQLAAKIMVVGYAYAILSAAFPLFGISGYSSTSICLPMDTGDTASVAYILLLLAFTGFAFFLICACYAQIYFSLNYETRHCPGERTLARKMTLLVGTNFACWAPIAFFSLTAVAGYPLIDVTRSKILLVFFYPINSCANPYLYAILTAQYRKDFINLLARYGLCTKCAQEYKMVYQQPKSAQTSLPRLLHTDSVRTAEVAV
uniref:G-protein coupled receptors family 1 profile domain-containing protein n=1 Tax=Clastoptera arizonana TaxID=38151 RepID=A0A1B6E925_9HEMI